MSRVLAGRSGPIVAPRAIRHVRDFIVIDTQRRRPRDTRCVARVAIVGGSNVPGGLSGRLRSVMATYACGISDSAVIKTNRHSPSRRVVAARAIQGRCDVSGGFAIGVDGVMTGAAWRRRSAVVHSSSLGEPCCQAMAHFALSGGNDMRLGFSEGHRSIVATIALFRRPLENTTGVTGLARQEFMPANQGKSGR